MSYGLEVRTSQCGAWTPVLFAGIRVVRILINLQLIQPNVNLPFRRAYLWCGLEPRITCNYRMGSKRKVSQVKGKGKVIPLQARCGPEGG